MFRLPRALLDAEVARQYCHTDAASVTETSDHVIISPYLNHDPDDYWVEGAGRLGLLTMLANGDGAQAQALLRRRFRGNAAVPAGRSGPPRTATQLRSAAEERAEARKKAEEQRRREEQARKAAAEAAAHAKRLDDLATEGEAAWKRVNDMIATKKTSEYDLAVALLRDLRALAKRQGKDETATFRKRVLDLRAQYPTRPGLQGRLDRSNMPRAEAR